MTTPQPYTISMEEALEMVALAKEQGYTTDEALKMLAEHGLIEDSDDDMD